MVNNNEIKRLTPAEVSKLAIQIVENTTTEEYMLYLIALNKQQSEEINNGLH